MAAGCRGLGGSVRNGILTGGGHLTTDTRELTFVMALNEALRQEMLRDPNVIIMGEDVGVLEPGGIYGVTKELLKEFGPQRVRDTPISEAGFIGTAIGAAVSGLRPVVELMYVDFSGVAMDQIMNQAAKLRYMFGGQVNVPLVIRTTIGAGLSAGPHHSQCLYSVFAHIPGLKVVVPSTPYDAKGLLTTAIRDDDPVMIFEHKMLYGTKGFVPEGPYAIPLGKADVKREGLDVTVATLGLMVPRALRAAEELEKTGAASVEVLDLRTLVPLDEKTLLDSVRKTGRFVVVDEDYEYCGFSGEITARVAEKAFDYLDAPVRRVATRNVPVPFSPTLEAFIIPSEKDIAQAIVGIV